MELRKLTIQSFRNLSSLTLAPGPGFNVFWGANGAGKTSILEAIHTLSQGKSFRSGAVRDLIQYQQSSFVISAELVRSGSLHHIGIERSRERMRARIDYEDVGSIRELARNLPVISIHPGSFALITGEPAARRAFLDWGLFFADAGFHDHWLRYARALKQRNAAIRLGSSPRLIRQWDEALVEHGEIISRARQGYLQQIAEGLPSTAEQFSWQDKLALNYRWGWPDNQSLAEVLEQNIDRDRQLGFTFAGPHRGDFSTRFCDHDAARFGSRGQVKMITLLLKLTQARLFANQFDRKCVLLLDDVASELDQERQLQLIGVVYRLGLQTFVTSVEKNAELYRGASDTRMFHVKHGKLSRNSHRVV